MWATSASLLSGIRACSQTQTTAQATSASPVGQKGLTPPSSTCLVLLASWPPPSAKARTSSLSGHRLHCACVLRPPGLRSQRGRTLEGRSGQSSGRPRIRFRPLPFACVSRLHVSVFGYVRPLAAGLGKPRCAELGRGGGSQAGERRGGAASLQVPESFKFS